MNPSQSITNITEYATKDAVIIYTKLCEINALYESALQSNKLLLQHVLETENERKENDDNISTASPKNINKKSTSM